MRSVRGRRKTEKRKRLVGRGGRSHAGREDSRTSKGWGKENDAIRVGAFFSPCIPSFIEHLKLPLEILYLGSVSLCSKITESITRRKEANPGMGVGYMVHVHGEWQQWEKPAWKDVARAAACFARHSTSQTEVLLLRACHRRSWLKVLVSEKERE